MILACDVNSAPLRLLARLLLLLTHRNYFLKSKGSHDHPRPETKQEAEARRSIQKAKTAFSSSSLRLKRLQEIEVTLTIINEILVRQSVVEGMVEAIWALALGGRRPYICTFCTPMIRPTRTRAVLSILLSLALSSTASNPFQSKFVPGGSRRLHLHR